LIKSTGNGEKVLNDYKALRNTSLTPPSYIHALHKEKLPSIIRNRVWVEWWGSESTYERSPGNLPTPHPQFTPTLPKY